MHPDVHSQALDLAEAISDLTGVVRHDVAVVLGSGFGAYKDHVQGVEIPYSRLPGIPTPAAAGHGGALVSTSIGPNRVLLFSGRVHAYEGHPIDQIVAGVRGAIMSGCKVVVLTNAAGGCGPGQKPGDIVLLSDHLNLTGINPLVGPNDDRLGPRFPDLTRTYSPRLRSIARTAAAAEGLEVGEGVYAWFLGPTYETPAEVRMAQVLGADLVGMSTVPEAIAANHMGAEVLGVSLVTNLAAGISAGPLSSDEVIETAGENRGRLIRLLDAVLANV